ncbi:MAG: arginase [Melioribacteraceae bacterium]|nr:arginase [Melioribacteraceae bacterium]
MNKVKNTKRIDVIGFPMDLGADRRGVDMGASALRIAGIENKLIKMGYDVVDLGDIYIQNQEKQSVKHTKLKYLKEIVKTSEELALMVEKSLDAGHFPLCLGGDHSIALGSIAGIAAHCKKSNKRLGVIWIDAHSDMNTEETTPSGNIHGMPVAAALGLGNEALTHIKGFAPKVEPENIALLGIRSIDSRERKTIQDLNLQVYTMTDIDRKGINFIITKILKELKERVDHIHVSFDLDSVDPDVAPGVGTPVPGGLSYRETHLIMETIAECGCMASLEIAETNPILDNKNRSAEFAAELVASSMGKRIL